MKACIQCGEQTDTKFCPNCGQNQHIKRLALSTFFHDFFSRIYGLDGAFPNTVIGLARNPAKVAKEYIKGIRGRYVGPVGFYFLMFAIFLLIVQISELTLTDYFPNTEEYAESMFSQDSNDKRQQAREIGLVVKGIVFRNIQYVAVLMIPFFALWCKVLFRKSSYNYLETLVFSFFIFGEAIIFNIIGFLTLSFTGFQSNLLLTIMMVIYYVWCTSLFYRGKAKLGTMFKGLIVYGLANFSFFLFLTIIVTIGLFINGGIG